MWAIGVLVVALVQCAYALRLPGFGTQPKPSAVSSNDPSPSTLISVARDFVTGGFGVVDPTLLSDKSFACSGQLFSLNDKKRYVSALSKETSAFRRAMPDFEFRPYDFEIDPENKNTVWFKIRPRGTITGPFTYKTDVYLPNKKAIELPLQLCSVSIDETNKVSRVTAGYVIDRFTGNTGGYPGPFGVLYALGYAPNPLQFLPPAAVLRRVFARTRKPENLRVGSSPFPESVMLGLAKALLDSSLGAAGGGLFNVHLCVLPSSSRISSLSLSLPVSLSHLAPPADPSLLSDSFTFSGPIVGPLPKKEFVRAFSSFNLKVRRNALHSCTHIYVHIYTHMHMHMHMHNQTTTPHSHIPPPHPCTHTHTRPPFQTSPPAPARSESTPTSPTECGLSPAARAP